MKEAIISLIGVIIGAAIGAGATLISSCINERMETKRHKERLMQNEHEIKREDSLRRLYEFLLPIKDIYRRSDQLCEHLDDEYRIKGEGLCSDYKPELERVMGKDYRLLNIEIWEKYHKINNEYEEELERRADLSHISAQEYYGEKIKDYFFDNDRQFIDLVNKKAQEIEQEYVNDNI
ncbi:hypothetical protein [Tetragenococcus halophilus]|uniref:hypothetical protein n=1 Tax=Tetragenococcus halophilus TaxID=51669 RepID=UPI0030CC97A9